MINREQMIAIRQRLADCPRTQAPGGSVCNTMRALAYLGAEVGYIGKIGTDAIGAYYEEALRKAHNLKGVCGSLGLTKLQAQLAALVKLLRSEGFTAEQVAGQLNYIRPEWERTLDCIRRLDA